MIIEIEGLDGSGKSTQVELLKNYFNKKNISYDYIHFPNYENKFSGKLISKLLQGQFGKLDEIDPELSSFLFAIDRLYMKDRIENSDKEVIILDRYFYSNILIQCAKPKVKFDNLFNWLYELEFDHHKIPKPDYVFYLDVPFKFVKKNILDRHDEDREYLDGRKDIYENDFKFQKNVMNIAHKLCNLGYMTQIECYDSNKNILNPEDIHNKIISKISDI